MRQWSIGRRLSLVTLMVLALLGLLLFFCLQIYQQGLMGEKSRQTRAPDRERAAALVQQCCEHGLLILSAGTGGNVIRFLTPLVITDAQLEEGLDVIEEQLNRSEQP